MPAERTGPVLRPVWPIRLSARSLWAGAALVALAGCAGQPSKPVSAERSPELAKQAHPSTVPANAPDNDEIDDTRGPDADVIRRDYVPHEWPEPARDLWSAIRHDFSLAPNAKRRSVRAWTQFYATHTDHLDASLARAQPFLWHVVQQIEARDMPGEIALLPIVESGYNPAAKSYAGASGMWQFMPGTADHMRLTRDWWYDGRNDPLASTDAALNYLQALNDRYNGDWFLALAAYNAGPGRVDRAIERADREGISTAYWNLELPEETQEYVPQLLALRRIMMTPARFGLDWPTLANRPRTRHVSLPAQTDMQIAADMLGMSEDALRKLNPGLRRWASDPNRPTQLLVPSAKADAFESRLAQIDPSKLVDSAHHTVRRGDSLSRIAQAYDVSVASLRQANDIHGSRIGVGQRLTIPRPGRAAEPAADVPSQTYVVQSGDTLWHIANRYNVSVASLKRANDSAATSLRIGQKLDIPGAARPPAPTTYVVERGDTLWSIARTNEVSVADLRRWNRMTPGASLSPGTTIALDGPSELPNFYEVEAGDSLWSIADRFSMQVATLRSLNNMSAQSTIRPGERLRLQPAVSS